MSIKKNLDFHPVPNFFYDINWVYGRLVGLKVNRTNLYLGSHVLSIYMTLTANLIAFFVFYRTVCTVHTYIDVNKRKE